MTLLPSTMPHEVCPAVVNLSQRISISSFGRGLRLGFPCARCGTLEAEIFAQGLAGVILVEQPAALQFRHDVFDEVGIGARYIGGGDDKAVAAAALEHLFQPVGDLLRAAD